MRFNSIYKKLNTIIFGEFYTFEGDIFYWLIDWGTMLYRTPLQRALSGIGLYTYLVGLFVFITYAVLTQPQTDLLVEYLATASCMAGLLVNYHMMMRKFDVVQIGIRHIKNISSKGRPASKNLISNNVKFMKRCKIFAILLVSLCLLSYISFILFVNKENNLAFIIAKNVLLDKKIPKAIIFLVVVPHSVLFISIPTCLSCYSVAHTSFGLNALIEQIDTLIEFENECNDVSKYRKSELYQDIINKNLKYFSWQFNTLKRYNKYYNQFGKWIFLVLYGIGAFTMSSVFIFIIANKSQETIPYIGIFIMLTILFSMLSEIGQSMQDLERLLLSVLPEHVAVQMRQDLDSTDSQFKKIYMSRHENVSILYADIVGFTAISSTYSAQELVKMLNELFARFDKLAEKYQQLRIKILGDCYYCISGAPKESPDHAVLSVHMGLSMVKAIKYVQQTANSPVDMRVGIHTGAVLAGVLGQRQWQFDVYSKDVELANKMESSGLAGRVHISDATLSFLNGEFEVEPGFGEKRDEFLRIAGLKTYFIVKVLIPFQPKIQEVQNGGNILPEEDSCVIAEVSESKEEEAANESNVERTRQDSTDFKIRLRKELVNRDGHKELAKNTKCINLAFVDPQKEKSYHLHIESFSSFTLLMFLIVRLAIGSTIAIVLPSDLTIDITYCTENIVFFVLVIIAIAEEFPGLSKCWRAFKESMFIRRLLSTTCIMLMGTVNIVDSVSCVQFKRQSDNCSTILDLDATCLYPSYFSYFTVLILVAASLPACLSYLWKSFLMLIIAVGQCSANIMVLGSAIDCEESMKHWTSLIQGKYTLSGLLITATFALAYLARHMEKVCRVLFLWRCEVEEQRDCAEDMRRRNEALVYNILPPHVAAHFMGNRKRQHDDLYSQSYAEVGVLFASMPNFSDFYSEETVNNQGLECLRFLNEVISDFDALLELPHFQDVIKIKTIGSTYMAASGLNPTRQMKPEDEISVRWAHLAILVEFALELKKALQSINEQSFNHFVLKLGINHGPITAGVIGARKPHYDIWGNTVNVASRMESTGKAGCIQVTEETCEILQHFGYQFEQRGLVTVKGKGQLMTYYLLGKTGKITPPTAPVSPVTGIGTMETVNEEDESHDSPTSKSDDKTVIECSDKMDDDVFTSDSGCEEVKESTEVSLLLSNYNNCE